MSNKNNLLYYSVNSKLANHINNNYYGGKHYVWVAPFFDCDTNPASSNPKEIYKSFRKALKKGKIDHHSINIQRNRAGLKEGAAKMAASGKIKEEIKNLIVELSELAEHEHFEPLIYVIPSEKVNSRVKVVPQTSKANVLSLEYIIADLCDSEFDIIKL